jgi:trehalose 6-phosphate synthase
MPLEERRARHAAMLRVLRANDVYAWRDRFLEALSAAGGRRLAAGGPAA